CATADCLGHAYKIGHRLDQNKKPCDDFSAFVCSAWEQKSRGIGTSGTLEDTLFDWLAEMTDVLRKNSSRLRVDSKLQAMFSSCVGRIIEDKTSTLQVARTFMADRGLSWPDISPANVNALEVLVELAVNWMIPLWFQISLLPATESRPRMIQIGHSMLVDAQYRLFRTIIDYDPVAYALYWSSFYDAFSTNNDSDRFKEDQYERDLNNQHMILRSLYRERKGEIRDIPFVTSLGSMTNSTFWINGLSKVYKLSDTISADDKVFITDKRLLDHIDGIFHRFANDELVAQLSWSLAQFSGIVAMDALVSSLLGSKQYASNFLPLLCSAEALFVYHQLFMESTAQTFPVEERESLDTFLGQITEEAVALVNSSNWIDKGSKDFLIEKLRETTTKIWPGNDTSTFYENIPDNETYFVSFWVETRRSLQTIPISTEYGRTVRRHGLDATLPEYNYLLNAIQLSVALLRPPFYYRQGTKAMKYAGLGFLYAKQLAHAFDENGICFRASGFSGAPAFPLETREAYVRKAFCGTSDSHVVLCAPKERNGSIFPSLPALQIVYSGFKKALDVGVDLRLKNLEGYTPEQVFFITLCFTTCYHDVVSGRSGGCNEFLRHFPPFAEAFHCSLLSGMNPQEKCETF
ncbi:unnamed protein product, partial [Ixodes hexagonus]